MFAPLGYIGFIVVATFFFFSGYGLMYNLEHKKDYLKTFFPKRFLSIFVPFWIVPAICIVVYAILGQPFTWWECLLGFLGARTVTGCWFVTTILIFYVLFFVSFSLCEKGKLGHTAPIVMVSAGLLVYCLILYFLDEHSSQTASVFAFVFGLTYSKFANKLTAWLKQRYVIKLLLSAVAFAVLYVGRIGLDYIGIQHELLHMFLRNVVSIAFVFMLICILHGIDFHNKVLLWFADISYAVYIVHSVLMAMLGFSLMKKPEIYVLIMVFGTIISSFVITVASNFILKKLNKRA